MAIYRSVRSPVTLGGGWGGGGHSLGILWWMPLTNVFSIHKDVIPFLKLSKPGSLSTLRSGWLETLSHFT
jgi:hypothetical protein